MHLQKLVVNGQDVAAARYCVFSWGLSPNSTISPDTTELQRALKAPRLEWRIPGVMTFFSPSAVLAKTLYQSARPGHCYRPSLPDPARARVSDEQCRADLTAVRGRGDIYGVASRIPCSCLCNLDLLLVSRGTASSPQTNSFGHLELRSIVEKCNASVRGRPDLGSIFT